MKNEVNDKLQNSKSITINNKEILVFSQKDEDYISLTDLAKHKNPELTGLVISHWLSTRYTIEFMGLWERINNPGFNITEFSEIKNQSGSNGFVLSSKQWTEKTNAIGIVSKAGRYHGGTYAHKDIAFEFASWISPEIKFYLIREFQRLKQDENQRLNLGWNLQRTLAKINYHIHTDAIKERIIPPEITRDQANAIYASEADLLNMALFGQTAKEWRENNPNKEGNIRDYAELEQLVVLTNLESINALLVRQGLNQSDRLIKLNETAISQTNSLMENQNIRRLATSENKSTLKK